MANEALSVLPVPLTKVYTCESLTSGSVVDKVPTVVPLAAFSATVLALNAIAVGASFTLLTVIAKADSTDKPAASVARTRTV